MDLSDYTFCVHAHICGNVAAAAADADDDFDKETIFWNGEREEEEEKNLLVCAPFGFDAVYVDIMVG